MVDIERTPVVNYTVHECKLISSEMRPCQQSDLICARGDMNLNRTRSIILLDVNEV